MAKAKKERGLTPKQEKFVAEYVKNGMGKSRYKHKRAWDEYEAAQ